VVAVREVLIMEGDMAIMEGGEVGTCQLGISRVLFSECDRIDLETMLVTFVGFRVFFYRRNKILIPFLMPLYFVPKSFLYMVRIF